MTPRESLLLVAGALVLGIGGYRWKVSHDESLAFRAKQVEQTRIYQAMAHKPAGQVGRAFTDDEVFLFLAEARKAENIADPLQRCLNYPDPPGSHWSPASVAAYCHYNTQHVISLAEVDALIRSGHAADLDRHFAQDLQAQLTQPESHGLLDRTFYADFSDGSFNTRQTLDAWKRDSPDSAFAYAASGWAYVGMAQRARGGAYIRATPQSNIDSMDRLLSLADTDLQHAFALNPKISPMYVAMINAGSLSLGGEYLRTAVARAAVAAPDDYDVYDTLSGAMQPRWGGSLQAMKSVTGQAQAHVAENPLLALLLATEPAYRYDVCNCESSAVWTAFPVVFDNVASTDLLFRAGSAANNEDHPDLAAIYFSEELRFLPDEPFGHIRRGFALANLGDPEWAMEEANRRISLKPGSAWGYSMRGYTYMTTRDFVHAAPDLEKAYALDSDNVFPLVQLGNIYVFSTHDWNKGWDVANRLIRNHPNEAGGWILRASIQNGQPRAGLDDTVQYFLEHFGNDPEQANWASKMRVMLAAQNGKAIAVGKGVKSL